MTITETSRTETPRRGGAPAMIKKSVAAVAMALAMLVGTVGVDIASEESNHNVVLDGAASAISALGLGTTSAAAEVSSNYWWGHATWYSINDVRRLGGYYDILRKVKKACDRMGGNWFVKQACKALVGRYAGWIVDGWDTAEREGKCLQINMTWTGQVIKVRPYSCNWY